MTNRQAAGGSGGSILTLGGESGEPGPDAAYGILAQSIGGGGGNGSSILSTNFSQGQNALVMGAHFGGRGGKGGNGGLVTVTNEHLIETHGTGAHGIFAQSIGGGGGNGGLVLAGNAVVRSSVEARPLITVGGAGGDGANGSAVTVNNHGEILTRGANAHGIVAQSIGGGGGNAGIGIGLVNGAFGGATLANGVLFRAPGAPARRHRSRGRPGRRRHRWHRHGQPHR